MATGMVGAAAIAMAMVLAMVVVTIPNANAMQPPPLSPDGVMNAGGGIMPTARQKYDEAMDQAVHLTLADSLTQLLKLAE